MARQPQIIEATETTPPQILNEDLMPDANENGISPSARLLVDEWYAAHPELTQDEK